MRALIIDDEHQVGPGYPEMKEAHAAFDPVAWDLATMTPKAGLYPGQKAGAQEKLSPRDVASRQGAGL